MRDLLLRTSRRRALAVLTGGLCLGLASSAPAALLCPATPTLVIYADNASRDEAVALVREGELRDLVTQVQAAMSVVP